MCDNKQVIPIQEGIIKKGGINPKPSTPRPNPPKAQANKEQQTISRPSQNTEQ